MRLGCHSDSMRDWWQAGQGCWSSGTVGEEWSFLRTPTPSPLIQLHISREMFHLWHVGSAGFIIIQAFTESESDLIKLATLPTSSRWSLLLIWTLKHIFKTISIVLTPKTLDWSELRTQITHAHSKLDFLINCYVNSGNPIVLHKVSWFTITLFKLIYANCFELQ